MRNETMKSELRSVLKVWFSIFKDADKSNLANAKIWNDWRNPNYKNEPNAILESEIVLTFLLPQDILREWSIEPNMNNAAVGLRDFLHECTGYESHTEQIELVVEILIAHFERLTNKGGQIFSTPEYLDPNSNLRHVPMVDAYSLGVSVSLSAKRLAHRIIEDRLVRQKANPNHITKKAKKLMHFADARLTECLKGLLASFSVSATPWDNWHNSGKSIESPWSWPGRENPNVDEKSESSRQLFSAKQKLKGLGFQIADDEAFECGWSWGPILRSDHEWDCLFGKGKTDKESEQSLWTAVPDVARSQALLAENAPYLYFTTIALDGIEDLLDPANYSTGLLSNEQIIYASKIQAFESATRSYWHALARAPAKDGYHKRLIELVPWKTADGQASVYWNIFILRICSDLLRDDSERNDWLFNLIERLAESGLILREPIPEDSDTSLSLHWPGLLVKLESYENNSQGSDSEDEDEKARIESSDKWVIYDYTPQLLKLAIRNSLRETDYRKRFNWSRLLATIWKNLEQRKDQITPIGSSWDRIDKIFPTYVDALKDKGEMGEIAGEKSLPWPDAEFQQDSRSGELRTVSSWYFTERVVEAIVMFLSQEELRTTESPYLEEMMAEILFGLRGDMAEDTIASLEERLEQSPASALKLLFRKLGQA